MTWLKNTDGKPDAVLTFSAVSLAVILVKFIFSEITIGPLAMGNLDAGVIAAILTPCLGSYCARRYTDKLNPNKDDSNAK